MAENKKQLTKEEMVVRIAGLEQQAEKNYRLDLSIREALSEMLDSFKKRGQFDHGENEVKILDWPQIYFRIGKLKERAIKDEAKIAETNLLMALRQQVSRTGGSGKILPPYQP